MEIWLTALLSFAAVAISGIWQYTNHVVTIAHEGGHALVAVLAGRRLSGIRLHSDTSGLTVTRGRPTGLGMVLTGFAGYTAPSMLGVLAAWLTSSGHSRTLLATSLLFLGAMLVMIRNVFGFVSVVAAGGLIFVVTWYATESIQSVSAQLISWFLLFGGARDVYELQRTRRAGAANSDADTLEDLTGVPGIVWVLLFGVVALGALFVGGRLLLGR